MSSPDIIENIDLPTCDGPDSCPTATGGTSISLGEEHSCALTTTGGVKCWGRNDNGQLGDGTMPTYRTAPVDVFGLTSGVTSIAASEEHTCALTAAGGAKCWGYNAYGQLGDDTRTDRRSPVDVSGLTSRVKAIAAGDRHTCALTTGGGAKCWGHNNRGQLGDETSTRRTTPVDVSGLTSGVKAIAAGAWHTCAVTTGGGVKCWGYNGRGQLGDSTETDSWIPVDVSEMASGAKAIAAGARHTCALTTGSGVKCWGAKASVGTLGDGNDTDRLTPVDVSGLTTGVTAISAGDRHTCALTTEGGVKCWGSNRYGQLGDGTIFSSATPVEVSELTSGVRAIAAGANHTCAVTIEEGAKCWGHNDYGQLGDDTGPRARLP